MADGQPFDLVEHHLRARRHLLVTIDLAWQDHAHRVGRAGAHRMNLAWRGMCAQQYLLTARRRLDVERVPHITRRVVRWHIQQAEVILVGLHLRAFPDLEADLSESAVDRYENRRSWCE